MEDFSLRNGVIAQVEYFALFSGPLLFSML